MYIILKLTTARKSQIHTNRAVLWPNGRPKSYGVGRFSKLLDDKVSVNIVCIIAFWYSNQQVYVRWHNTVSDWFMIGNGTRQGGVWSPALFAFLRAKAAMLSARFSHRNSVRPSVRLSVCLSHGWIRQKRSKLGSPNLHHRLPGRL